jgi:hypothetical protein
LHLETVLVGDVVEGDWVTVWSDVRVESLLHLDLTVLDSGVLDVSLFLDIDAIASLVSVLVRAVVVLLRVELQDRDGSGRVVLVMVVGNWDGTGDGEEG